MVADLQTRKQLVRNAEDAISALRKGGTPQDRAQIYPLYYVPDPRIAGLIDEIRKYRKKSKPTDPERQQAGYTLEKIAILAFASVTGSDSRKSFPSAGGQYDLILRGSNADWLGVLELLGLKKGQSVVLEAKATKAKVSHATFSRLCSIMAFNLPNSSAMGVFFTLNGASGFPVPGKPPKRAIGQARLQQALFHARRRKPIIVFRWEDIEQLTKKGSLLQLIDDKIVDLEELSGLSLKRVNGKETALPSYLAGLV